MAVPTGASNPSEESEPSSSTAPASCGDRPAPSPGSLAALPSAAPVGATEPPHPDPPRPKPRATVATPRQTSAGVVGGGVTRGLRGSLKSDSFGDTAFEAQREIP